MIGFENVLEEFQLFSSWPLSVLGEALNNSPVVFSLGNKLTFDTDLLYLASNYGKTPTSLSKPKLRTKNGSMHTFFFFVKKQVKE